LVVVAIIAVLAAMLFPAVQRLREMANRTSCVNNLHQIGMALGNHFTTHGSFPTNGATIPSTATGYPFSLTSYPGASPSPYMWAMADSTQGPKGQTGSWAYAILPFMEETNAFKNGDYAAGIALFMCPSRGRPSAQDLSSPDSFGWFYNAQNGATSPPTPLIRWAKTDYAGNYLAMPNLNDPRNLRPVGGLASYPAAPPFPDGNSSTIVVGEKAMAVSAYMTGGWYWDEPIFVGGSGGTTRGVPTSAPNANVGTPFYSQTPIAPNQVTFPGPPAVQFYYYPAKLGPPAGVPSSPGIFADNDANMSASSPFPYIFANNYGSAHPGGVNFLFADGSVRTFNYNVNPSLFQGLLTPAGSDATPPES
jgi:prepilin-type processing-associated H-X9-DG protein